MSSLDYLTYFLHLSWIPFADRYVSKYSCSVCPGVAHISALSPKAYRSIIVEYPERQIILSALSKADFISGLSRCGTFLILPVVFSVSFPGVPFIMRTLDCLFLYFSETSFSNIPR